MYYSKKIVNYKINTTTNENGEILQQDKWTEIQKYPKIKGGWVRTYEDAYRNVLTSLNSILEQTILFEIQDSIKNDFTCIFNQTKMAKKLKVTRETISRTVSKLYKVNYLKKIDGIIYANPFVYIPYGISGENIEKAQNKWNTLEDNNG